MKKRYGTALAGLLLCALLAPVSCVAPPPAGFITPGPQKRGNVQMSAQGGAGFTYAGVGGAGGALHIEPFVTRRLSIPLTGVVADGMGMDVGGLEEHAETTMYWYGQARLGLRYRIRDHITVGGGLLGNARIVRHCYGMDDWECDSKRTDGGFSLDFEWSYGHRWKYVGLSFAQKLTWEATTLLGFQLSNELTCALFPGGGPFAFTLHAGLVYILPTGIYFTASAGLMIMI